MQTLFINLSYLISAICFVLGLKMLSNPEKARKGNLVSAIGMLIAIIATLIQKEVVELRFIMLGLAVGSIIGAIIAKSVKMTSMPEMVALSHGFGGLASLFVGWIAYVVHPEQISIFITFTIFLAILIGGITFSGSMVAFGKLSELLPSKPFIFPLQRFFNFSLLGSLIIAGIIWILTLTPSFSFLIFIIIGSLILGVLLIIPIGGADMPVVISLLNSYSGLAACATGFVVKNNELIVSGALVGASGFILTTIMCKAMNRSILNLLFSGFGKLVKYKEEEGNKEVKSITPKDAYYVLEAAKNVVIVPGYGMAVAQAQHQVKALASALENNGCEVEYAIHPVAGRMPGHMNVLLAEADVPYEQLKEMDDINPKMDRVDVALVIGANDVVNPAARDDSSSPIYGMPIIEVDRAKNVFVLKRSMATGFAGIPNPLFYKENTSMIFGDAKKTLQAMIDEF